MIGRLINLSVLVILTALFWFAKLNYPTTTMGKAYASFLALSITYFVFKFLFEEVIGMRITDKKARYMTKKTASALYWVVSFIIVLRIWILNPQALLVAYGLVGAGIAVALQDVFKNFAGGIIILLSGVYRVGDRIQVGESYGDVIDITVMYTTVMEMKEWVGGDQATGRLCTLPNGVVLGNSVHNYTKDYRFIWDEISIPITYDSDWKGASAAFSAIAKRETRESTAQAGREIDRIGNKYYLTKRQVEPAIFTTLTDNWIMITIRYVADPRERRVLHNKLTQLFLEEIQKSKDIKIASTTLNIVGFPDIKLKK